MSTPVSNKSLSTLKFESCHVKVLGIKVGRNKRDETQSMKTPSRYKSEVITVKEDLKPSTTNYKYKG